MSEHRGSLTVGFPCNNGSKSFCASLTGRLKLHEIMHGEDLVCSWDPQEMQTTSTLSASGRKKPKSYEVRCPDCPPSSPETPPFSSRPALPGSESAAPWGSAHRRPATYLDVIGVCEKHGDAVDAHAPASRGGQPVFQGRAEVFIYEHGFVVASSLSLQENQRATVFQAARSLRV